ncbi:hypothetical protein IEQ34_006440 [Dendrobium chrysotoxum]|uniref:Uncharacterized protein n=1 Tax=Dendrobium chrysotoxum TaxID=161865 RepID=A0AAV7HES8_DENCH|nr:hypothetical protein IEQ34_006440 [Dendrobium chrysotoxum]
MVAVNGGHIRQSFTLTIRLKRFIRWQSPTGLAGPDPTPFRAHSRVGPSSILVASLKHGARKAKPSPTTVGGGVFMRAGRFFNVLKLGLLLPDVAVGRRAMVLGIEPEAHLSFRHG